MLLVWCKPPCKANAPNNQGRYYYHESCSFNNLCKNSLSTTYLHQALYHGKFCNFKNNVYVWDQTFPPFLKVSYLVTFCNIYVTRYFLLAHESRLPMYCVYIVTKKTHHVNLSNCLCFIVLSISISLWLLFIFLPFVLFVSLFFYTQRQSKLHWLLTLQLPYFIEYSVHFLHWKWCQNILWTLYMEGNWERV
jgi:hypothetical protein